MNIVERIKQNPTLKNRALWLLMPKGASRPRWWVSAFVNPYYHQKGTGTVIRPTVRKDVLPFHRFTLGKAVTIEDYCVINNGMGDVVIGDNSFIGISNVIIGPVEIGKRVIIAQHVVISGLNHGYEDIDCPIKDQPCTTGKIVIGEDSWIGANAVITAGVTIGRHAVVAGGSVVTKSVPDYCVVAGNPARRIKAYDNKAQKWVSLSK